MDNSIYSSLTVYRIGCILKRLEYTGKSLPRERAKSLTPSKSLQYTPSGKAVTSRETISPSIISYQYTVRVGLWCEAIEGLG